MTSGFINGTKYELEGNNKPTLVLVHGLGLNREMWQYQIRYFRDKYRVLSYDLYGHGQSRNANRDPSLDIFTQQLKFLLEALNLSKVVLIGFSLGGMIARHFTQTYPDKIRSLVILNSPHKREALAQRTVFDRYNKVLKFGPKSTVEEAIKRWFTPNFGKHNKEKENLVRSWVLANKPDVYAKNYHVLVNGVEEVIDKKGQISCPTLVVTADEDFGNGPEMAEAIANEIEGAKLIILRGLRHMALFEDPEGVNKHLIKFLKGACDER